MSLSRILKLTGIVSWLLAGIFLTAIPSQAYPWEEKSNGLFGGNVYALVIDPVTPETVYATSYNGGVYKSTNGGGNWVECNNGLPDLKVWSLAMDPAAPNTIYAGTNSNGVYKTTDGGENWSAANAGMTNQAVISLSIAPDDPATVLAGTDGSGVYKTTDGGENWTAANNGIVHSQIHCLAADPSTPGMVFAGTGGGISKSTDGGENWTTVNSGITNLLIKAIAIDPDDPATVYAGTYVGGVFKSTDNGENWTAVNTGLANTRIRALAIDPDASSTVYVGTHGDGVFKSTDAGGSWTSANNGLATASIQVLATEPGTPNTVYGGTLSGAIFKSVDGGDNWSAANTGLTNLHVLSLATDPGAPAIVYAGTNGSGVFKTTDSGENWTAVNTGLTDLVVSSLALAPSDPNLIFAGTDGGGVFKTTDAGENWTAVNTGLTNLEVLSLTLASSDPNILFAGTDGGGVFKTTDAGENWTAVNTGLTNLEVLSLTLASSDPNILFAGTYGGGVYKSENGGLNWAAVNNGLTNVFVSALLIPDHSSPDTVYAGTSGGGVFKSPDGGANWTAVNNGLTNLSIRALSVPGPSAPATLYAGTFGGGVYKSPDGGANWFAVNDGLTNLDILSLALATFNPDTVYAGTRGKGAWKALDPDILPAIATPIADVTVNEDAADTTIDLGAVFTDPDNDDSAITKAVLSNSNSTLVEASISGDTLTLDYQPDQNGAATIEIRGTSNGRTVDDSFLVTVHPVDDPPRLANPIGDFTVLKNSGPSIIDLSNVFTDPDNDDSAITKAVLSNSNTALVDASISGNTLTLDYQPGQTGTATIEIRGTSNGQTMDDSFLATVKVPYTSSGGVVFSISSNVSITGSAALFSGTAASVTVKQGGTLTVYAGAELISPFINGTVINKGTLSGTKNDPAIVGPTGVVKGGTLKGFIRVEAGGAIEGEASNPIVLTEGEGSIILEPGAILSGFIQINNAGGTSALIRIPAGVSLGHTDSVTLAPENLLSYAEANGWFADLDIPPIPSMYQIVSGILLSKNGLPVSDPTQITLHVDVSRLPAGTDISNLEVLGYDPARACWQWLPATSTGDEYLKVQTHLIAGFAIVIPDASLRTTVTWGGTEYSIINCDSVYLQLEYALSQMLPDQDVRVAPMNDLAWIHLGGQAFPMVSFGLSFVSASYSVGPVSAEAEMLALNKNGGLTLEVLLADNRLVQLAPMVADPEGLDRLFSGMKMEYLPDWGMVIIGNDDEVKLVAGFGPDAGTPDGPKALAGLLMKGSDPAGADFRAQLAFDDSSAQDAPPFAAAMGELVNFLNACKRSKVISGYFVSRSTGIIQVELNEGSTMAWKPDYKLYPLSREDSAWLEANINAYGFAVRAKDANNDGLSDLECLSIKGKQVLYTME